MSARIEHGRSAWLRSRCRCSTCHREMLEYSRVRGAVATVRRGGVPATRVPVRKVRRRVDELVKAGWTQCRIAAAAGVDDSVICRIVGGKARRVALSTELAILAIES